MAEVERTTARQGPMTADLNIAEQFVLRALRTRLEGAAKRDRLAEGFSLACDGVSDGAARAAFEPWFEVLATHCRRNLYLHRTPCPCLSGDERAMVGLVASAQAGDEARLHRLAAALVHPRAIGLLLGASRSFAGALCMLGLHLSGREAQPGPGTAPLHQRIFSISSHRPPSQPPKGTHRRVVGGGAGRGRGSTQADNGPD